MRDLISFPAFQFSVILVISAYYFAVRESVVLDDAFIYFRVAENFIRTGKPVFNIGDNHFIATSPLWTFLLALMKIIFPFLALEVIAKLLWIILLAAASYIAYLTFSPLIGRWSVWAPCPFFLSPVVGSMTGNEIALLYAAMFGIMWASFRNRPALIGLFLGIGYLARGEFALMIFPVMIYFIIKESRVGSFSFKRTLIRIINILKITFLIGIVWHTYYWLTFHGFFPETFHVKMIQGRSGQWILYQQAIWKSVAWLLGEKWYLLPFAVVGALWQPRIAGFMAIYTLIHSLIYALLKLPFYHWYYYDYYIYILFLILLGIFRTIDYFPRFLSPLSSGINLADRFRLSYDFVHPILITFIVLWIFNVRFSLFLPGHASDIYYNNGRDERYNTYRELSVKLREELGRNDIVLTEEAGICSHYLQNYEVRDVAGISTPDITETDVYNWAYFIDLYKPRYLVFIKAIRKEFEYFKYGQKTYIYKLRFITNQTAAHFGGTVYAASPP